MMIFCLPQVTAWAFDSEALVNLLIKRDPAKGLVKEVSLLRAGISKTLAHRVSNRADDFEASLKFRPAEERTAAIDVFHRETFDFILREKDVNTMTTFGGSFELGLGHESDVSLRPDGESVPSAESSVVRSWALDAHWEGRQSPWGKWKFSFKSVGQDHERDKLEAYDLHDLGLAIDVNYASGWRWSLAQDWLLYGASGSQDLGNALTRYEWGYDRVVTDRAYMVSWSTFLRVEKHNFRDSFAVAVNGEKRDRWATSLHGQWAYESECRHGRLRFEWQEALINSSSPHSAFEYFALDSHGKLLIAPKESEVTVSVALGYLKKLDHRRAGSKSNDSLWQGELEVTRPLWNHRTEGYLKAFYRDLRAKVTNVEFSGEGVAAGVDLSW
jgi:hypothetical protein